MGFIAPLLIIFVGGVITNLIIRWAIKQLKPEKRTLRYIFGLSFIPAGYFYYMLASAIILCFDPGPDIGFAAFAITLIVGPIAAVCLIAQVTIGILAFRKPTK